MVGEYENKNDIEYKNRITRAANMIILKKVSDTMKIPGERLYEEVLCLNRKTCDRIIEASEGAGARWEYKKVAQKLKMDPKVFSGERLLRIDADIIREIKKEYRAEGGKIQNRIKRDKFLREEESNTSEFEVWHYIFNEEIYDADDIWHQTRMELLREVAKRTKTETFHDEQLWLFWNYLRKL